MQELNFYSREAFSPLDFKKKSYYAKVSLLKFLSKYKTRLDNDHWIWVNVGWLVSLLTITPLLWLWICNSLLKKETEETPRPPLLTIVLPSQQ